MSFMAAKLAYFKVPAPVELRDAPLPRHAIGKGMKHVLTGGGRTRSSKSRWADAKPGGRRLTGLA